MPVCVLLCWSCAFSVSSSGAENASRNLSRAESPDGRVRASLDVSPAEPRLADTILLTLTVRADATLKIDLPAFGAMLGELTVLDVSEQTGGVGTDTETKTVVLKTVPTRAGPTPIWPVPIEYSDRRSGLQDKQYSLVLPPCSLDVRADIDPETASLDDIDTPPELLPVPTENRVWIVVALAALLTAAALLLLARKMRRREESVERIERLSPREIAVQRLTELISRRLHETDVKRFFIELTGIVRWYIERQTGIRAPELTTEEFLREISERRREQNRLTPELRDRLRLFLESSDMVKFAKFEPSRDEIMLGYRRAEEFITAFDRRHETENDA